MAFVLGEFIAVNDLKWAIVTVATILIIIKIITKIKILVFAMIFFFIILGYIVTGNEEKKQVSISSLDNINIEITGNVYKIEHAKTGYNIFLQNVKVKNNNYKQILVTTGDVSNIHIGNRLIVKGKFKIFKKNTNPGNFDSRSYYMSMGLYGQIKASEIVVESDTKDILRDKLYILKKQIEANLDNVCNKKGYFKIFKNKNKIFQAMVLGDKSEMDEEITELYSVSGIAHVLAISGLHISIVGIYIYKLLRKKQGFAVSGAVSTFIVICFGIVSGMKIATVRALTMFLLRLLGDAIGRNYDYLTAMSFAMLMMITTNPFIIYNSGFQMTFIAIFFISILWERVQYILEIEKHKKKEEIRKTANEKVKGNEEYKDKGNIKIKQWLIKVKITLLNWLIFGISISIFMLPIIAYSYFQIPTYSFVLNMLVVPLMSVVVVSAVLGMVLSFVGDIVSAISLFPGVLILELYQKISSFILKVPYANIIVGKPYLWLVISYYVLIIIIVFVLEKLKKNNEKKIKLKMKSISTKGISVRKLKLKHKELNRTKNKFPVVLVVAVSLLVYLIYVMPSEYERVFETKVLYVTSIDVGQGDGIFIKTPGGTTITIDGGSTTEKDVEKYKISPFIKYTGTGLINYAVMTHADEDHINGLVELIKKSKQNNIKVKNLILPDIKVKDEKYMELKDIAEKNSVNVKYISAGVTLKIDDITFECIHPDREYLAEDRNDYSTVLNMKYNNFSMLFTGDISEKVEERLIENERISKVTVLKVAHHGSKYSTTTKLLEKATPQYAIISVGEYNRYGHPTKETLSRLINQKIKVFRTDADGAVTIKTDGETMDITGQNKPIAIYK